MQFSMCDTITELNVKNNPHPTNISKSRGASRDFKENSKSLHIKIKYYSFLCILEKCICDTGNIFSE